MTRLRSIIVRLLATALVAGAASCARSHASPPQWLTFPDPPAMPRADTMALIAARGGARLYAAVFHRGGPSPVLLLHGGLQHGDEWAFEVARLRPSHEVIVLDTRGQGRSTLGSEPLSYELFADDAVTILDSLQVEQVAVVGWSDGAITGLRLAIDHPAHVAGLLAFGGQFDNSGNITTPADTAIDALGRQYMIRAAADYRRLSPTPDRFAMLVKAIGTLESRGPNITPRELQSIHVPTTIAAADHDQFVTAAHTARMASLIPGARLRIVRGVSHEAPLQDSDGFDRVVQDFLRTVRY